MYRKASLNSTEAVTLCLGRSCMFLLQNHTSCVDDHYRLSPAATLKLGEFHQNFLNVFAPVVEGYLDDLEVTLVQDLNRSFAVEIWMPVRYDVIMISWSKVVCGMLTRKSRFCIVP